MGIADRVSRSWRGVVDPGWVRGRPTRRQQQFDVMLAALFAGVATISLVLLISVAGFYSAEPMTLGGQMWWVPALAAPLIWRRRYPVTVAVVVAAVFAVAGLTGFVDNLIASVALFCALYTVGAWCRNRLLAFWIRLAIIVGMFGMLCYSLVEYSAEEDFSGGASFLGPVDPGLANVLYSLLVNVGYFAAAAFFGTSAWTSARREYALREQTAQLAAAQEITAQRAVMQERVEIARELHDVVAHHVSVMGVQASAARRVLTKSPELASVALSAVEGTARMAITELRGLLGVLRATGTPADPATETPRAAPGLDQLPDLVAGTGSAGLQTSFGVFGDVRPVSSAVSVSAYRIVQESLTNVIKHARASTVTVRLRYLAGHVEVEIDDNGVGQGLGRTQTGGYGLVGMRERVGVHRGSLDAGNRTGGGFRVRARLSSPTGPDAATAAVPEIPLAAVVDVGSGSTS